MGTRKVEIDSRLIKIIDVLGGESDYITLEELAKKLSLKRRQIEYGIERIDEIFYFLDMPYIDKKQNAGVRLQEEHLLWFGKIFKDGERKVKFVYQKDERVAFIIAHIIIGGSSYKSEDFCNHLGISSTTLFADMQTVTQKIEEYGATLHYDYYYKYYIKASGIQYSKLLKNSAKTLFSTIPEDVFKYLVAPEIYEELIKLEKVK